MHLGCFAEHAAELVTIFEVTTKVANLHVDSGFFKSRTGRFLHASQVKGLHDKITGPALEHIDCCFDIGISGDRDHRDIGIILLHARNQLDTVHARELDVRNHKIDISIRELLQRIFSGRDRDDSVAAMGIQAHQLATDYRVIINHEDIGDQRTHGSALLRLRIIILQ